MSGVHYDPFRRNEAAIVATLHALATRTLGVRDQVWLCAGATQPYRVSSTRRSYGEFDLLEDARDFMRLLLLGNPDLELLS